MEKDCFVDKLEFRESQKFLEMMKNRKWKKDGSRNWLSSFCIYKFSELDYFYVPIYYNNYVRLYNYLIRQS